MSHYWLTQFGFRPYGPQQFPWRLTYETVTNFKIRLQMKLLKHLLLAFCLGSGANPGWSAEQEPQPLVPGKVSSVMWDGDCLVEMKFLSPELTYWNPAGTSAKVQAPSGGLGISVLNRTFSAIRMVDDTLVYSRMPPGENWQDYLISWEKGKRSQGLRGIPFSMLETRSGKRFLAMSTLPGFGQGGAVSLCSWWVQGPNGVVEPESLIPMELGESVFEPEIGPKVLPWPKLKARYAGLAPFLEFPLRSRDAFLVVSLNAGIIWVVPEDGHTPMRVVRMMALSDDQLSGKQLHLPVILDLQPMVNGHVLVAMRSEKAVRDPPKVPGSSAEVEAKDHARNGSGEPERPRDILQPEIIWKELDPLEGKPEDPDPEFLADAPRALDPDRPFHFSFDPEGRLKATGGKRMNLFL